jgi:hypothetical protein
MKMQSERRSGQRHAVQLSVELRHAGNENKVCRVHNLAPDGMLLENRTGLLDIGAQIELVVSRSERTWTVPATVTHCNSNCIGVMFSQRQSELYRTVNQPLKQVDQTASGRNSVVLRPSQGKARSL